jgi:hypothetical protein
MLNKINKPVLLYIAMILSLSFLLAGCTASTVSEKILQKVREKTDNDQTAENNVTDNQAAGNNGAANVASPNPVQGNYGDVIANNEIISGDYAALKNIADDKLTPDQKILKRKAGLVLPVELKKDIGASLKVCNIGSSCSGDVGSTHWMSSASININDAKRGLSWGTDEPGVKDGLLQISLSPFNKMWPGKDVIYSQNIKTGSSIFDFETLFGSANASKPSSLKRVPQITAKSPSKSLTNIISGARKIIAQPAEPAIDLIASINSAANLNVFSNFKPRYYIRIAPMLNGKIAGIPSNDVTVEMVAPPKEIKLYTPPKAYTIKIKDFKPLLNPDKGVCSHAMILDTDYKINGNIFKKAGDRICPAPYKGIGEKAWYEQLWDGLKSGLSWISEAYNKLKSSIVDIVGSVACGGDSTCKMALSAGLDIGLAALGVPPTIPNFDQLVDGGFDYLAGEISAQAGCPDAVCREAIKTGLKKALDQNKNTDPGCDATMAHNMGIEPVCLPAGVKAHWDPAATYRDAQATLEISRNFVNIPNESMSTTSYKVIFTNWASNDKPVGQSIINIEPYGKSMKIEKPLEGSLFSYKTIAIPYIEKGKKIEIPINLTAEEYWVPGHKELMGGWSTVIYKDGWPQYQYDDWWLLYYGANMTIQAQIDGCKFAGSGCIVSSATKEINLPTTLNP